MINMCRVGHMPVAGMPFTCAVLFW